MLQWYIRALADPSVIVLIIPREWHPLGAVARMGSAPSFLVIALRNANNLLDESDAFTRIHGPTRVIKLP